MASLITHHSPYGAADFLGLRTSRTGGLEIVYDDGVARRLVWRVTGTTDPRLAGEGLKAALRRDRVVPALYSEMKKRAIAIEVVGSR